MLNVGYLIPDKNEATKWLKNYMETNDKAERLNKLQLLHLEALMEPNIIPLVSSPYVALIRKPWAIKLPKYFANNSLWLLEKN